MNSLNVNNFLETSNKFINLLKNFQILKVESNLIEWKLLEVSGI